MGLGRALQLRALPAHNEAVPNPWSGETVPGYQMFGGRRKRVLLPPTEREALAVPAFWRGHNYVCGTVGMLPVTAMQDTVQLEPQPAILRQPDISQTPMAFWAGVASALTLYGNSVCLITDIDRGLGYPAALKLIHPLHAAVRLAGDPSEPDIGGWYISGHFVDPSRVWHVKSFVALPGQPLGMGLLDGSPDGIAAAVAVADYAASYFAGGGVPPGVLKIHRPDVTQAQADEAKALWIRKQAGKAEPAVLNELTDFTPLAFNPVNSQMIESRQLSLTDIALLWGLPPSKLGSNSGTGTYRNAEHEEIQARNDGVSPWTRLLEQAVSLSLLPHGQRASWRLDAYLRSDTLSRFRAYQTALGGPGPQSAWMLTDEVRALEELDPMADALADDVAAGLAGHIAEPPVSGNQSGPDAPNPSTARNGVAPNG
jgi:HK97 family phage portal protein